MEIKRISAHTLSIYLDASDLDELDITYEALDVLCPHTRLVIRQLLETALAQTGFDPKGERLLIEAYPVVDEGCLLLFTLAQVKQEDRVRSAEPTLFLFSSFDLLRQACRQLDPLLSSALYWQNGQYILALQGQTCPLGAAAADSELLLADLVENDCCLLKENAVSLLNQYFNERRN